MSEPNVRPVRALTNIPAHLTITDKTVRHLDGVCNKCHAQAHIGQYDDPNTADQLMAEWVARHLHNKAKKEQA